MLKKSDVFLVILAADFVFYRCSRYKALLRILHDITVRIQNLICLFMGGIGCELLFVFSWSKETIQNIHPLHKNQFGPSDLECQKIPFGAFGHKKILNALTLES